MTKNSIKFMSKCKKKKKKSIKEEKGVHGTCQ